MKKIKIKKIHYFHYLCLIITLIFIVFAVFKFKNAGIRIIESFKDLFTSAKYYLKELLYFKYKVTPTINNYSKIPFTPIFKLPASWDEFTIKWKVYWKVWATSSNFKEYCLLLSKIIYNVSQIVLLLGIPLFLILYILLSRYFKKQNNDYNKDSKPLKFYKKHILTKYIIVREWLKSFIEFIKEHKIYYKLWLIIWAWNFNIITIFIEFIAFYLYFVMSFDIKNIYRQIYKLICDLSVMIAFLPPVAWLIIGYVVICIVRKNIGYERLKHYENRNCGFINELPIVVMACGSMGKKKTTLITDIALSQEVIFRNKALKLLLDNDLKFSQFPWINLENAIKYAIRKHIIFNLATAKKYVKHLKYCFDYNYVYEDKTMRKCIRRHLKKSYNLPYNNLCFDYDYLTYGLIYDDKLKVENLWQIIEKYTKLYFIYIIQSSLIISNYSVRTDNILEYLGNFPLWDSDFFKRDSKKIDIISRHSKILDFDALRLGQKVIEDNKNKDSFEFGVVNITEIGKERKNNLELKDTKKSELGANQKNDGFTDYLKMSRHSATVDNYPFIKFVSDEQRPESLGADARDLCQLVYVSKVQDEKITMPFFFISELIYAFAVEKFIKAYIKYRYKRGDNTLFMYLLKGLFSKFYNYYKGIYNIFGYSKIEIDVENGTQTGEKDKRKYYLMNKKIYSKRFSTDCFSDFFMEKSSKSKIGLADLEEYKTEKATFEELKKQNSYFINELISKNKK